MESAGAPCRVIEIMSEEDLRTVLEWAGREGWNPGMKDAAPFRVADAGGFFAVRGEEGGELMAGISAVRYGESYGFIGLYICAPELRGRGHGTAVFRHAMAHLEGRTIGLDAVPAQQATYTKYGFVLAHQVVRFGGEISTSSPPPVAGGGEDGGVDALTTKEHVDLVVAFDDEHLPARREEFTRAWLNTPGHIVRTVIVDGEVKGYGVLRPCVDGAKIGPLFASSGEVAELLAKALVVAATTTTSASATVKIMLDVPAPNRQGVQLAERLGLTEMGQTGRMYRGPAPKLPLDRIFGVTSLELG